MIPTLYEQTLTVLLDECEAAIDACERIRLEKEAEEESRRRKAAAEYREKQERLARMVMGVVPSVPGVSE
jgi:hypothetical protein